MRPNNYKINASPALLAIVLWFLMPSFFARAQHIDITGNGFIYQQNFNSLTSSGSWSNGNTVAGWYAASEELGTYNAFATSAGGSDNHGLYSFGSVNSVNGSGDRALGSLNKDESGDIVYGVMFKNTSGVTINSVKVSIQAEQWRRVNTNKKGYQRVKLSYRVGNSISTNAAGLFSDQFLDLPDGSMVTLDTTKVNESMDGNAEGNFGRITLVFPVVIPNNHKFFLRFRDENVFHVDAALAVDDFKAEFFTSSTDRVTTTSTYSFHAYLDQAVLTDIPGDSPENIYTIPGANDLSAWSGILSDFFDGNFSDSLNDYGYDWVEFTCLTSEKTYQILRKKNESQYYWGTYARLVNPANPVLTIQAPHPLKDADTEKQAASVFELTGASVLMVAGTDRCNSTTLSSCAGTTDICNVNNQKFRRSDVAHDVETIFHVATMELAAHESEMKFVQLHGFSQTGNDPEFIVSAGLQDHSNKSGIDYPGLFKAALASSALPDKDIKVTHLDNYSQLAALDNVQGRFLNAYQGGNICTSENSPTKATNRFLHIEQYRTVRENPIYYDDIATIISGVVNSTNENIPYVEISNANSDYQQAFDGLSSQSSTAAWTNDHTIDAWHATRSGNGPLTDYRIGTGSSTSYGLYSFGASQNSERAIGSLNQDESGAFVFGVLFYNNSGETIENLNLSYRAEQWRVSTNAAHQRIKLSYAIASDIDPTPAWMLNNSNFTNFSNGDLITLQTGAGSSQALNGNQYFTNIDVDIPVTLANENYLFIRFYDDNATGIDHAMALDDFVITFSNDGLMPVQLGNFTLEKTSGTQITATWNTLYEVDCSHYFIDNAGDNLDWEPLARIEGAGTTKEAQFYSWVHTKPIRDKGYYRLRQVDFNGDEKVLGVRYLQLNTTSDELNATLYPNPASKDFTIESDSYLSDVTIKVWDKTMGRMIETKSFDDFGRRQTIDAQSLSKGHYVVELRTRTGRQVMPLAILK